MKGKRPQERWIGVTGNHRRHPLSRTILLASFCITSYWHSGCRLGLSRIDSVHGDWIRDSIIYWGGKIQIQVCSAWALEPSQLPTKPCLNSIFKPQPSRPKPVACIPKLSPAVWVQGTLFSWGTVPNCSDKTSSIQTWLWSFACTSWRRLMWLTSYLASSYGVRFSWRSQLGYSISIGVQTVKQGSEVLCTSWSREMWLTM